MMESTGQHEISNEYTEIYSRIPLRLQLAYGIGHVLNDICASMWFTYLLVYFHLVLKFSNAEAGFVLLVGQIADAMATPFVGFQSDRSEFRWARDYGKRKTWHMMGTIAVLITFPQIFSPSYIVNQQWSLIYYCVVVVIFQFGWAAVQISHLSLIPELTPNEHDRTKLTAIRYCFTVISNLLVFIITWFFLHISSNSNAPVGPQDSSKFQAVVWSGMFIGLIASALFHICVKESNGYAGNDVRGVQLRTSVRDLLTSLEVYQVALVYMSTRLFVNLSQVFIPLYLHEALQMAASALALIPLIMYIGSFVTSMLIECLNRTFGRRFSYLVGTLFGVLACVWIQVRSGPDFIEYDIYVVAVLFGISGSIILVTSLGITADLIGDKTGSGAFVYGVMSFCDKLSNGIAVVVIQELHKDANKTYYRDVISYVCGGAAILGSIAVISLIKRIRDVRSEYEEIPGYASINADNTCSDEIQSLIS